MKTIRSFARWFFTLLVILLLIAFPSRPGGLVQAAPLLTLQERINAAADGAILDIDGGTYTENMTVHNKNITLRGSTAAITTIQAADSSQRVIYADSDKGLHLENLVITGGHPSGAVGGGIYAAGGVLQIFNCRITGNSTDYGGGIFLDNASSSLVVSASLIDLNAAGVDGGGIYASGSASLTNSEVNGNTANRHGGGLHTQSGITTLIGGKFVNNKAMTGNGGAINVNNGMNISATQFLNNASAVLGGAITQWVDAAVNTIDGATISANTASGSSDEVKGGGAYIAGALTLTNTTFSGNKADTLSSGKNVRGGGLYVQGLLSIDHSNFIGNEAKCSACSFNEGGGLYAGWKSAAITINRSTFDGNKGWFGGGVCANYAIVTHSAFLNGSGGYGGGLDSVTFSGEDLLFQANSVVNSGGALDVSDIVSLTHARFSDNLAGYKGGAIIINGSFNGSNLLFSHNRASYSAGVLYVSSAASASLYNITIAQPSQSTGPAVYLDIGAQLHLYNSIVNNYTNAILLAGSGSTLSEDYNLFYGNGVDLSLGDGAIYNPGGHSTGFIPPRFRNPGVGDYHLLPNSKAIGAGYNFGLDSDLDYRPRYATRTDIGAYQYWMDIFLPLASR